MHRSLEDLVSWDFADHVLSDFVSGGAEQGLLWVLWCFC